MGSEAVVQKTTDQVRTWLQELHGFLEETPGGQMTFRQGSARVFVGVIPYGDDGSVVSLNAWVLMNVPRSAELFERLSFLNGEMSFIKFYADENDDPSLVDIGCGATLLGTYLDQGELDLAAVAVAFETDNIDDILQKEFGGERFHED